jgi:hypothetical protein
MNGVKLDDFHQDWIKLVEPDEVRKIRRQFWTFVLWPDSKEFEIVHKSGMPFERFLQYVLSEAVIPSLVSPIHDKDVKDDGTPAKPHYHVILFFEKPVRYQQVLNQMRIGCGFESLTYLQPVANIRAMMRYLTHLDTPWKAQYSPDDVLQICGAEYVIAEETASEIVINTILNENVTTYTLLLSKLVHNPSARKWVLSNANIVKNLLVEQGQLRKLVDNCPKLVTVYNYQTEHILSDFLGTEES